MRIVIGKFHIELHQFTSSVMTILNIGIGRFQNPVTWCNGVIITFLNNTVHIGIDEEGK